MKQIPIFMTTDMVLATLNGSKRQTRRIIDMQPPAGAVQISTFHHPGPREHFYAYNRRGRLMDWCQPCKHGQHGDLLYVRETWQHSNWPHGPYDDECEVFYRADYADDPHGFDGEKSPEGKYRSWNPSIHLPKARSRILLRVGEVRVERLQDITEADAQAEGAMFWAQRQDMPIRHLNGGDDRIAFIALWESIYGAGSWDLNPWVWVIDFTKVKP